MRIFQSSFATSILVVWATSVSAASPPADMPQSPPALVQKLRDVRDVHIDHQPYKPNAHVVHEIFQTARYTTKPQCASTPTTPTTLAFQNVIKNYNFRWSEDSSAQPIVGRPCDANMTRWRLSWQKPNGQLTAHFTVTSPQALLLSLTLDPRFSPALDKLVQQASKITQSDKPITSQQKKVLLSVLGIKPAQHPFRHNASYAGVTYQAPYVVTVKGLSKPITLEFTNAPTNSFIRISYGNGEDQQVLGVVTNERFPTTEQAASVNLRDPSLQPLTSSAPPSLTP